MVFPHPPTQPLTQYSLVSQLFLSVLSSYLNSNWRDLSTVGCSPLDPGLGIDHTQTPVPKHKANTMISFIKQGREKVTESELYRNSSK